MSKKHIYIAGSFTNDKSRKSLEKMIELVKVHFSSPLYIPMDHKVPFDYQLPDGSWYLSNAAWAQEVFSMDLKAIDEASVVVAMYTGHFGTTGTSWEIGYSFAKGIPVVLYIPSWVKEPDFSLMVFNSAVQYMDEFGNVFPITKSWLNQFNQK